VNFGHRLGLDSCQVIERCEAEGRVGGEIKGGLFDAREQPKTWIDLPQIKPGFIDRILGYGSRIK
jgi:hypothetical protein